MVGPYSKSGTLDNETLLRLAALTQGLKRRTLDLLDIHLGDRVLDVGCGSGIDTLAMAPIVGREGFVAGVDLDERSIRAADEAAQRAGFSSWTRHLVSDACSVPYSNGTFDASRSERLFQHAPRVTAVLAEMIRVTKPGGRIAAADADWATLSIDTAETSLERRICLALAGTARNGYAGRELLRWFREQGLASITVEVHPIVWTNYSAFRATSLSTPDIDKRMEASGVVSPEEWRRFLKNMEAAGRRDCFFASGNMVLVAGTKPE